MNGCSEKAAGGLIQGIEKKLCVENLLTGVCMKNGFGVIELFKLGGPFMWILLLFSIAMLAIIIERCVYIFWHDCRVENLSESVKALLVQGKKREAKQLEMMMVEKKMNVDEDDVAPNRAVFAVLGTEVQLDDG